MFLVVFSKPAPSYIAWHGRRMLAAADAVAWPAFWIWAIHEHAPAAGIAARWAIAVLCCVACRRLWRALMDNEHYGFATLRWAKVLLWIWVFGFALKHVAST